MTTNEQDPMETVLDQAREAYRRGDHVFQYSQSASLESAYTGARYSRPFKPVQNMSMVNDIIREGWELLDGSVERWESGNYLYMVGFYLFRRRDESGPTTGAASRTEVSTPATVPPVLAAAAPAQVPGSAPPPQAPAALQFPPPMGATGRPRGAGWYQDPASPGQFQRRWWDGTAWTDQVDG